MAPDAQLLALIDAHAAGRARIQDRVFAGLAGVWSAFDGWYRPSAVSDAAGQAASVVSAGQAGQAALTDAFMAGMASLVRASVVSPAGVDPAVRGSLRSGVSGSDVQARVAGEFRWQIYRGVDPAGALDVALNRSREAASADLGLAFQRQVSDFTTKRQVKQFRRVTRGEGVCGLCAAASNRVYTRGDLLPIHSRCRCSVVEIDPRGAVNTGVSVDDAMYKALAGKSRSLSAKDLADVRYVVDDHGELGPVLRNAKQRVSKVDSSGRLESKVTHVEQKKLAPAHGLSTASSADLNNAEGIARKALAFAEKNGLPEQVKFHRARLDAIAARRAQAGQ